MAQGRVILWDFDGTLGERPGGWSGVLAETLAAELMGSGFSADDFRAAAGMVRYPIMLPMYDGRISNEVLTNRQQRCTFTARQTQAGAILNAGGEQTPTGWCASTGLVGVLLCRDSIADAPSDIPPYPHP